jgi:hypothetical protein
VHPAVCLSVELWFVPSVRGEMQWEP